MCGIKRRNRARSPTQTAISRVPFLTGALEIGLDTQYPVRSLPVEAGLNAANYPIDVRIVLVSARQRSGRESEEDRRKPSDSDVVL